MGCGLRKEIENMLLLVPGEYRLKLTKLSRCIIYEILHQEHPVVAGYGFSKAAALKDLLYNWRHGRSGFGPAEVKCPACSKEELAMKLELLGIDSRQRRASRQLKSLDIACHGI